MRALGGALIALVLAGCSEPAPDASAAVTADWQAFEATPTTVPARLAPDARATLAGAWSLASADTDRLHDISDIKADGYGRLFLVSDVGDLIELPEAVAERRSAGRLRRLTGRMGLPLAEKETGDAEGLVVLPDGQVLVSFERRHRITLYSGQGVYVGPANAPTGRMKPNRGIEAIAETPDGGWWAAAEDGRLWRCGFGERCRREKARLAGPGVAVTGMALDPRTGRLLVLRREMRPKGFVSSIWAVDPVRLVERDPPMAEVARLDAAAGLPDNFEGIGARRLADGRLRLWLVSDDGFNSRTVLVALDLS
ncbi:MAG TPA: esterase-like activity of phytase family protein [Caulobacteraceae bacterium]|nr:esterase-like activity of phytase family protein [Caulobacteraceae bacterium]